MDALPDELILRIFSFLDVRDRIKCSRLCSRWNKLAKSDELWRNFSLTDIQKPKWCTSKLVNLESTNDLIRNRFSRFITRVDLSKLCFTFETLNILFQHCQQIKSLCINFKYLQIKAPFIRVEECIKSWPMEKLEKLYLKNVCDMKTRRLSFKFSSISKNCLNANASYDMIEVEIIKLIGTLFRKNSNSLRVLGLKCVDPNIISSCMSDFGALEILLLNNINDTDSLLDDLANNCPNLKCLEIDKCREFQGDGLQEIFEQCTKLETLQLGKNIYPTISELREINWSNLRNLKELAITTKFQTNEEQSSSSSGSSSSSSSDVMRATSTDIYAKTLFNFLNESKLEYFTLTDFTLRFPSEPCPLEERNTIPRIYPRKRMRTDSDLLYSDKLPSDLKYLVLRNNRNVKHMTPYQRTELKEFMLNQRNLETLDLTGLYLDTKFLTEIIANLPFLKNLYFGHGKSYKKSSSTRKFLKERLFNFGAQQYAGDCIINIDDINNLIANTCFCLVNYGIFYRQSELRFRRDEKVEFRNQALINLFEKCESLKEISYLKSFKIQDDDDDEEEDYVDDDDDDDDDKDDEDEDFSDDEISFKKEKQKNKKAYFYYIKYAIQNASIKSPHVNMKPCYGFDITPSSGNLFDTNNASFIETSLPLIKPPKNDFHKNVLRV